MLKLSNQESSSVINQLTLENFRNHSKFDLNSIDSSVLIYGANGTGKTSILESISLFSNSKGMRNATFLEMLKKNEKSFSINLHLQMNSFVNTSLTCNYNEVQNKKQFALNGKEVKSISRIKMLIPMLCIAPYTEKIFIGPSSLRRLFVDNLVCNFDLTHAKRINEYEKILRERSKLLKEGNNDNEWLNSLEDTLSKLSVAICSMRLDFILRINRLLKKSLGNFPKVKILAENSLENHLTTKAAIDLEEELKIKFRISRKIDAILGGSREGCLRSDINILNLDKSMKARMCSSGEQKSLLISIVIACSRAIKESFSTSPVILLDEIFTHLDHKRKNDLLIELTSLGSQVWITTTEKERFLQKDYNFCYYQLK